MNRKTFYLDLLERALWTFIQAGGAVVIAQGEFTSLALKGAAIGGGLAVIKSLAVNKLPWTATNSASTLPADVDPPAEP